MTKFTNSVNGLNKNILGDNSNKFTSKYWNLKTFMQKTILIFKSKCANWLYQSESRKSFLAPGTKSYDFSQALQFGAAPYACNSYMSLAEAYDLKNNAKLKLLLISDESECVKQSMNDTLLHVPYFLGEKFRKKNTHFQMP